MPAHSPVLKMSRRASAAEPAPSRLAGLLLAGTLLVAAYLVLALGGTRPPLYLPAYGLLYLLAAAAILGVRPPQRWRPLVLVDGCVSALVLLPLVQLLAKTTVDRAATTTIFLHWSAAAAVYWTARLCARPGDRQRCAGLFAWSAGLLGLEAIVQLFLSPAAVLGLVPISVAVPMGTFIDRDDFAACMVLLLPFALLRALESRTPGRRMGAALAAALATAAVILSASRGGAMLVVLELVAAVLVHQRGWAAPRPGPRPHFARMSTAAAAGLLAALIVGATLAAGPQTLLARFGTQGFSDSLRGGMRTSALEMAEQRPLMGYGLGSWEDVYPRFAQFDNNRIVDYAHNDYAQLLAESGGVGAAALVLLLAAFCTLVGPAWRHAPQFTAAGGMALAGLALHASMEFVFHIPSLLILFALIAGLLSSNLGPAARAQSHHVAIA